MAVKSLNDLFVHTLRDAFYAEKQALKGMRAMQRKASSQELKRLIETHREETEEQIEKLTAVFDQLGLKARGVTCEAMNGIIEEAQEIMEEAADDATRDAGIVAAAQAVEHYEIARYGTLVAWAGTLGHTEAASLLSEIRDQEVATDEKLSQLAETLLNARADDGEGMDETAGEADDGSGSAKGSRGRKGRDKAA